MKQRLKPLLISLLALALMSVFTRTSEAQFVSFGAWKARSSSGGAGPTPAPDSWIAGPKGPPVTPTALTLSEIQQMTSVWTGSRVIFWGNWIDDDGGDSHSGVISSYDFATWNEISTTNGPLYKFDHCAVWTGTRMIVWGGHIDSNGAPTSTGASYDPATDSWTQLSTTNAPPGSSQPICTWTGSKLIVWGGMNDTTRLKTGGIYDPVNDSWSATTTTNAPTYKGGDSAVWTGSKLIVYGSDGKSYDPSTDTWTNLSATNSPGVRSNHAMLWTGSKVLIWGGSNSSYDNVNTGALYDPSNDTWTPMSVTNAPSVRNQPYAAWTGSKALIWGGYNAGDLKTGAAYDPATDTWIALPTSGAPNGRRFGSGLWSGKSFMITGGSAQSGATLTSKEYDPVSNTWKAYGALEAGSPPPVSFSPEGRFGNASLAVGNRYFIWGGQPSAFGGGTPYSDGAIYDPASNSWAAIAPTSLGARNNFCSAAVGTKVVIWGGDLSGVDLGDGAVYDSSSDAWSPMASSSAPSGRSLPACVSTGSAVIVANGVKNSDGTAITGGAVYTPATDSWTAISTTNQPAVGGTVQAWTGTEMIMYAPDSRSGARYNPATNVWTTISISGAPSARTMTHSAWTGSLLIVWGGFGGSSDFNTGASYDPVTDTWSAIATTDAPAARSMASHFWSGSAFIVYGGLSMQTSATFTDGKRYDPATNTWSSVSSIGAPSARIYQSFAAVNGQMVVWGGLDLSGFQMLADLYLYNP